MKSHLMFRDRDFDLTAPMPWNEVALTQDLGLDVLCQAMARGDPFLLSVARQAVLHGTTDAETIRHRQAILQDCLKHRYIIEKLYAMALDAIERERKEYFGIFRDSPGAMLARSIRVLEIFVEILTELRQLADTYAATFESAGLRRLFADLREELSATFFEEVRAHLRHLKFRDGVPMSARLGRGLKGTDYVLRWSETDRWAWLRRLLGGGGDPGCSVHVHPRDDAGARCLGELRDRGINLIADAVAQSADHVLGFFHMLRTELAFYLGCLNLHDELDRRGLPTCLPTPATPAERRLSCRGLYDVGLALGLERRVVGNDLDGDGKLLVVITGANQGGKSTFLRALGLAQLMMQCGMFVAARSFAASVCDGIFTHYKREEDVTMQSGKLDEELKRMSEIVDHLTPEALLLFNEAFASTNEREGAEIARQVVRALLDEGRKVLFVTHLYDFARSVYDRHLPSAVFLRADRRVDGARTFKLSEGEPLETSFGPDLYRRIFAA